MTFSACTLLDNQDSWDISIAPKGNHIPMSTYFPLLLCPQMLATFICFLSLWICWLNFYISCKWNYIVCNLFFVSLLSCSMMFLRLTHAVESELHSFLWLNNISLIGICLLSLIYPSVDGHLGCLPFLAFVYICVQVFVWTAFNSLGYMARSRLAGPYGNSV